MFGWIFTWFSDILQQIGEHNFYQLDSTHFSHVDLIYLVHDFITNYDFLSKS